MHLPVPTRVTEGPSRTLQQSLTHAAMTLGDGTVLTSRGPALSALVFPIVCSLGMQTRGVHGCSPPHANTCSGLWTLGTPPWMPPVRPCLRPSAPPEGPADSPAGASERLRSQHPPPHQFSRITKEEEVPPERFPSCLFLNKNVWLLCNQCWKGRWGYL